MLKLFQVFRKPKKTMVFVDYEYWFYTYHSLYDLRPDPSAWRKAIEAKYDIADIMVFGDFSTPIISGELAKVRNITNTIIETGNTFAHKKKDMTDFIMLDYIYQCADNRNDIGTYIILTGDGHFQSVVKYLVQKKNKNVVVFGIEGSFSRQLQEAATSIEFLPTEDEKFQSYCRMVLSDLVYVSDKTKIIPTFMGTAEAVANFNRVPKEKIVSTISRMIELGYITRKDYRPPFGNTFKRLWVNWEVVIKAGLWDPEKQTVTSHE